MINASREESLSYAHGIKIISFIPDLGLLEFIIKMEGGRGMTLRKEKGSKITVIQICHEHCIRRGVEALFTVSFCR